MTSFLRAALCTRRSFLAGSLPITGSLLACAQNEPFPAESAAQRRDRVTPTPGESSDSLARKQQRKLIAQRFERMKEDADELTSLAKSLQDELDKSNENILSLQIVEKAGKIEKLAKRIKSAAKGF